MAATSDNLQAVQRSDGFWALGWCLLFFKAPLSSPGQGSTKGRKVPVAQGQALQSCHCPWQCPQGGWCQARRMSPAGAVLVLLLSELVLEQSCWFLGDLSKCSICFWRWRNRHP